VPMASIFSSIWPGIPATTPQTVYPQTRADPGELAVGGRGRQPGCRGGLSDRGCVQPSRRVRILLCGAGGAAAGAGSAFKPAHDALEPGAAALSGARFHHLRVLARAIAHQPANRGAVGEDTASRAPGSAALRPCPLCGTGCAAAPGQVISPSMGIDAGRLMFCNTSRTGRFTAEIDIQLGSFPRRICNGPLPRGCIWNVWSLRC